MLLYRIVHDYRKRLPGENIGFEFGANGRWYESNKMALFSRKPLATTALTNSRAVFMADGCVLRRKVVLFCEGLVAF